MQTDLYRYEFAEDSIKLLTQDFHSILTRTRTRPYNILHLIQPVAIALDDHLLSLMTAYLYAYRDFVFEFRDAFPVIVDTLREYVPQPPTAPWLRILHLYWDPTPDGVPKSEKAEAEDVEGLAYSDLDAYLGVSLGKDELCLLTVRWAPYLVQHPSVEQTVKSVSKLARYAFNVRRTSSSSSVPSSHSDTSESESTSTPGSPVTIRALTQTSLEIYIIYSLKDILVARYDPSGQCLSHKLIDISTFEGCSALAMKLLSQFVYSDPPVSLLIHDSDSETDSDSGSEYDPDPSLKLLGRRVCVGLPTLSTPYPVDYEKLIVSCKEVLQVDEKPQPREFFPPDETEVSSNCTAIFDSSRTFPAGLSWSSARS